MNKNIFAAIFLLGAMAVVWVGIGFVGTNPLALVMTVLIGAVYSSGANELFQFRRATTSLTTALATIPDNLSNLDDWLGKLHTSLQNSVRLRIEGERIGLPGPALTPYLVGLLVMLGMLGTFLGMVVTLNGAVFALEGTTDLQAIRTALAAPIKGLGLAFGTSLAGVAASAMLGLLSALCRRERIQAAQRLDNKIATVLRGFSLAHQRQEAFKALQFQAHALPDVVAKLQAMMMMMEHQSQQLNERLLSNQESFHSDIKSVYTELACSVDQSLKDSLAESARAAGQSIAPLAEAALMGIASEATQSHERMVNLAQTQLDVLSARIDTKASTVADKFLAALTHQEHNNEQMVNRIGQSLGLFAETFEQRSTSLLNAVGSEFSTLHIDQTNKDQQRLAAWTQSLASMATSLQSEWKKAGAQTLEQQQKICTTLATTASEIILQAQNNADHTLTEITRLLETAAEAPRAAAAVIGQLREELSSSMTRDNTLLEERSRMMETLNSLLEAINHASAEQRVTIDSLVASSEILLNRAGNQFAEKVDAESAKMSGVAAHVTSSAVEVSSLGESFSFAVQLFNDANEKLIANLQRIEASMDKSMTRSDDQLAYYVAQAREIIDLSTMSQKDIVDNLRQLAGKQMPLAAEVG